jgi:hypothetical protein
MNKFLALAAAAGACAAADRQLHFRSQEIRQDQPVSAVALVDLDDDGKPDILAGSAWFQNPTWTRRAISDKAGSPSASAVGAKLGWVNGQESQNVVWFENRRVLNRIRNSTLVQAKRQAKPPAPPSAIKDLGTRVGQAVSPAGLSAAR